MIGGGDASFFKSRLLPLDNVSYPHQFFKLSRVSKKGEITYRLFKAHKRIGRGEGVGTLHIYIYYTCACALSIHADLQPFANEKSCRREVRLFSKLKKNGVGSKLIG